MKAISYQLKIIEKKTRPVIWRRALIPYGITFSVLAYLLNEIMELEQPDFFQMKFADERVYLRESEKAGPADFHTEIWYDIRNARTLSLRTILQKEPGSPTHTELRRITG